jgi:hypothetical protein
MVFASAKTIFSSEWFGGAWWEVLEAVRRGEECRGSCRAAEQLVTDLNMDRYRVGSSPNVPSYLASPQVHRVGKERDGVMILYIGAENWPEPIPLVKANSVWYFDTDAGKEEILARRVGKNELVTIDVCYQLVDAQQHHYARSNEGEHRYALQFSGDNDGQEGLFSSENGEQPVSPHDSLIVSAGVENGTATSHHAVPFNGYYLGILTYQGKNAEGGAKSYLVNGKMLSGFAFVAYPAVYRSTGVMTFIVNQNGIVYQKDLGPDTEKIANAMTKYDPDSTWDRVE